MTEPSYEELKSRLADLEKQVETKKRSGAMEFRVSEKGGVSVYGLGRFPVTLYYEQWIKLLDAAPDLKAFIEENKSKLKTKQGESAGGGPLWWGRPPSPVQAERSSADRLWSRHL